MGWSVVEYAHIMPLSASVLGGSNGSGTQDYIVLFRADFGLLCVAMDVSSSCGVRADIRASNAFCNVAMDAKGNCFRLWSSGGIASGFYPLPDDK